MSKCKCFFILSALLLSASFSLSGFAQTQKHKHSHHAMHKAAPRKATHLAKKPTVPSTEPPATADLPTGLDAILSKVSPHAHIGVIVQTVDGSQVLYQHNSDDLFMPASVNKLFVAVASLDYLKSDYHFETRLRTNGKIDQGVLNGDLYVQFSGDPTLSDRQFVDLLNQLKILGINQINGQVYLDNTVYGSASYAPGWLLHDLIFGYAAPLNAVILNENRFAIILSPSEGGRPATVATTVPAGVVHVENNTTTSARHTECPLSVYSGSDNIYHVSGCVAKQPSKQYFALALRDPVIYARVLIANTLTKNNIGYNGTVGIQAAPAESMILATHQSLPLNLIVKEMLKDSDNLFTNSILKQIGSVYYQTQGTWQNGLNAVKQILGVSSSVDFNKIHLFDGSGLSRYNLVSPQQLAKLLSYAYQNQRIQPDIWNALPIAGQDGTLRGRLVNFAKQDAVHAKTGTMKNSGVSALAGYLQSRNHGLLVFVIMTNGLEDTHHVYKNTEDRICKLLLTAN